MEKTIRKKVLSVILTMALLISLMPMVTLPASASLPATGTYSTTVDQMYGMTILDYSTVTELSDYDPLEAYYTRPATSDSTPKYADLYYYSSGTLASYTNADTVSTSDQCIYFKATSAGTYRFNVTFWGYGASTGTKDYIYTVEITVEVTGAATPPTVTTTSVSTYTATTATLGGNVTDDGGASVTDRGVVYSSSDATPTIGESGVTKDTNGSGTGTFSESVSGLTASTTYYVSAYATNSAGTSYGSVVSFATLDAAATATFDFETNTSPIADNSGNTALGTVTQTVGDKTINIVATDGKFVIGEESELLGDLSVFSGKVMACNTADGGDPTSTRVRVSLPGYTFNLNTFEILDNYNVAHSGNTIKLISSSGAEYDVGTEIEYGGTDNGVATIDVSSNTAFQNITYFDLYANGNDMQLALDNIYLTNIKAAVSAPTVTTGAASSISSTAATLSGTVNANGASTTVTFEYGTDTSYGSTVTASPSSITGTSATAVCAALSGLATNTTYHYRVKGVNSVATTNGSDMTFSTDVTPPTATVVAQTVAAGANVTVQSTEPGTVFLISNSLDSAQYNTVSGLNALVTAGYATKVTIATADTDTTMAAPATTGTYAAVAVDAAGNISAKTTNLVTVDATAPTVSSVSVPSNGKYKAGETLSFTVNFSEAVTTVTTGGTPYIPVTLNTGGMVHASYVSGSGTSALVFSYTVVSGNQDMDGISVGSAISANGGTLRDAVGNDAELTLYSVGSTSNILVDGTAPTATVSAQTVAGGADVTVQSTEPGTVYLISNALAVTAYDTVSELNALVAAGSATKVTVSAASTNTTITAPSATGTYAAVAVDAAGNISAKTTNLVTVDQAPVSSLNAGLTVNEGAAGTITDTILKATDADTADASITYTVGTTPAHGTLKKAGVSLSANGTFTQADINNSLITYTHDGSDTTADSFTFTVSDGTSSIASQTFSITVNPVNDAPTLTATTSTPTFTEDGSAVNLFSNAAVGTVESGQTILSLKLTVSNVSDGNSEILNIDGTNVVLTAGTGTTATNGMTYLVTLSGSTATVALSKTGGISTTAAQTLVNGITYRNSSQNPTVSSARTVTLTAIQDSGGTANGGADTSTLSIASEVTVVAVNDAPTLTVVPGSAAYTENAVAIPVDSALTVSDPDNTTLASATIGISSNFQSSTDILAFDPTGTTGNISGNYDSSTGILILTSSGATATLAQWQDALRTVTFSSTSDNPGTATRIISFFINDGTTSGILATKNVTVAAVNDAPTDITLSASTILATSTGTNAVVGALTATDPDNSSFTYSLVNGTGDTDNSSFNILGADLRTAGTLTAGTYSIRVQVSDDDLTYEEILTISVTDKTAVTLTPDTTNHDVDHDIEITFAADADFTGKITGVSFNGHTLTADQYTVDTTNHNKVTLHPSAGTNVYLRTAANANVVIHATGYMDSTVSQTITAGAVTTLVVTAQPVPGAETGDAFATQPVITLKDQYGNICVNGPSATASVTASAVAGTGTWTLGGTVTKTAAGGVAAFSGLTCTMGTSGNGKMKFEADGKTVESSLFTIPERNSSISPVTGAFDIYESAANFKDITITLTLNGNTLTAVKNGPHTLVANTDYTLSGNTLTLKKEYLKTLSVGTVTLTLDFSMGTDPVFTVTITNSTPTNNNNTGSTTTTTNTPTNNNTNTNNGAAVIVNGESKTAGTSKTTTNSGGQTVTTVTVDSNKLESILASQSSGATVTIPITGTSDVAAGTLTGAMVKNMESKDATLIVQTDSGTYTLPASEINIDAVSQQLGANVSLADIDVTVSISEPSVSMTQIVENAAKDGGFTIMVPAVDYTITCNYRNQTVNVSSFNAYVERTIEIPDGVDPSKITTGVVVDSDGTVHHVPTRVTTIGGKYYAVINSLTNSTYSVVWNPIAFSDVDNHWAKDAINDMGSRMIVTGVGNNSYDPDRNMTRAEFAAIIVRALGLEPGTGDAGFGDVASADWYSGYIVTAASYGIIEGYDSGNFGPNDTITREQAMTMIARAMNITGLTVTLTDSDVNTLLGVYTDITAAADYARNSIASCVKAGITSGTSNATISPKDYITRAEVAVMVQRLLQQSGLI